MNSRNETDEKAFQQAVFEFAELAGTALGGAEGLDRASCSANIKFFAEVGIGAAARGFSSQGWRQEATKTRGLMPWPSSMRPRNACDRQDCGRGPDSPCPQQRPQCVRPSRDRGYSETRKSRPT